RPARDDRQGDEQHEGEVREPEPQRRLPGALGGDEERHAGEEQEGGEDAVDPHGGEVPAVLAAEDPPGPVHCGLPATASRKACSRSSGTSASSSRSQPWPRTAEAIRRATSGWPTSTWSPAAEGTPGTVRNNPS